MLLSACDHRLPRPDHSMYTTTRENLNVLSESLFQTVTLPTCEGTSCVELLSFLFLCRNILYNFYLTWDAWLLAFWPSRAGLVSSEGIFRNCQRKLKLEISSCLYRRHFCLVSMMSVRSFTFFINIIIFVLIIIINWAKAKELLNKTLYFFMFCRVCRLLPICTISTFCADTLKCNLRIINVFYPSVFIGMYSLSF